MNSRIALLTLLFLLLAAVSGLAQLYENGPVNGQDMGWTINFGFSVSDSFHLNSEAGVTEVEFWAWLIPGDTLTSVEFQIGAAAFGNELLDQTLNVTATNCFLNHLGYNVCDEFANLNGGGLSIGAGTYWLTLSNASVPSGDPAYWDMNSGVGCQSPGCPSLAQENTIGTIPSEAFSIHGPCDVRNNSPDCGPPSTPEPTSLLLFGSGIFGLAAMLRCKLR